MTEKVVLTQEGFQKLAEELNILKTKKRREAADALETARAHGDLRENAEYDAAKQMKQNLEARITMLEAKLGSAKIIDPTDIPADQALFGATLKLKNLDTGDTLTFMLVSEDEADFDQGKISISSPIGKGLLGKKKDETAEIQVPAGKVRYKILSITRE